MAEEARQALTQEEENICTALKADNNLEDIARLFRETDEFRVDSLDKHFCNQQPPQQPQRTVIGLTVEKASKEWPKNKAQVIALVKEQIKRGADFVKSLFIESKRHQPQGSVRTTVEILLDIIFSESDTDLRRNNCNLEGLASKAASNRDFLRAIDGLYKYYHEVNNDAKPSCCAKLCCAKPCCAKLFCAKLCCAKPCCAKSCCAKPCCAKLCCAKLEYKTLEIKHNELQNHEIQADPYFRSLKWLFETSTLFQVQNPEMMSGSQSKQYSCASCCGEVPPSAEETTRSRDDVFLETFQSISDIRSNIHGDAYFKSEYQNLSDQAEKFVVALIDDVQDEKELATVIKMEDKFSEVKERDDVKERERDDVVAPDEKESAPDIELQDKLSEGERNDVVAQDSLAWKGKGMERIPLIQHAVNLRCKSVCIKPV
jgi:hypothetical protein